MANEGNPGINKLANVLSGRMEEEGETALVLDFGSINSDYSLQTNTFPVPIPKSDYTVCRQLTLGSTGSTLTTTDSNGQHSHGEGGSHTHGGGSHTHDGGTHEGHEEGDGSHSHSGGEHSHEEAGSHSHPEAGAHTHNVLIPEKMRSLQPGDRVLVAWVQNEPVVIDLITSASNI